MLCGSDACVSQRRTEKPAGSAAQAWVLRVASLPFVFLAVLPTFSLLLSAARQQIGANERLQITIEHAIHIADFGFRAVILDHPVGLENIGANLRSEFYVELGIFNLLGGCSLLLHLEFVELGAQHAHGAFTVLVLRALVLATRDQPGGDVRNAHGRVGGIDMLPTLAAGAVSVSANVLRLDDDLDAVVNFGRNEHAGEGSMPPLGLIEGRYADEAVHPDLTLQKAKGVIPIYGEGSGFQARLFAGLVVVEHGF